VSAPEHESRLIQRLRERPAGSTIIYVTLQRTAEELATRLSDHGFAARAYHAGLEDGVRASVQDWFMSSTSGIVVATIAFGMGIDKADIRYVYHYNPPKSLENYSQEIGRAGRDGRPSVCEMLLCLDDLSSLENFAFGDTPSRAAVDRLVKEVFDQGPEFDVSFYELSSLCDIRPLVVRTLLTYLELDGFLAGGTPFFSSYRFQPLRPSAEILAEFNDERQQFLRRVLQHARKARTWFQIDLNEVTRTLDVPRDRVVRALDYLGERGWLKVDVSGARYRYRRLRVPSDMAALAESLHARSVGRERQEIARLGQVVELAHHPGCQVALLCQYFGEKPVKPCGHCTRCLGRDRAATPNVRTAPPLDETIFAAALAVQRANLPVLADPIVMARWLCGISSPALSKSKLSSHPLFGALAQQSFPQLRERLATLSSHREVDSTI
jgi:ATP-dependent DNA helicase RecQ